MQPITFDRICYRVAGKPVYLYSGEFHYFRVPRQDWRTRMELFKAAGGNAIATYVPWLLHEPVEGTFDFIGSAGQFDLEAFLQTAADVGLYVIARPGPYQYSELKYDGLPGWLCENFPNLRARDHQGKDFRVSSISYLHPLFLEKTRTWFAQVCPRIARHSVNRGGAVAFVQIDNEMGGIHWWAAGHDLNAEAMGIGQADGHFPRFLQRRHGSIERLNTLYGTSLASFSEVRPRLSENSGDPAIIRQARDYYDFYDWTLGEYARTLADLARSHGIDVPLVHNSPNPGSNPSYREMVAMVPQPFLLGADHYYTLSQDWPQNNPTPQYALNVFLSNEMLRLMGFPPTIFELPAGSLSDWPPILPHDAKACYYTNLALGMKGSNFYIFTGGVNPPGAGTTSDVYDYSAPVGPFGEVRPLYETIKEVGHFLHARPWFTETQRLADCRVAIDWEYPRSEKYFKAAGELPLTSTNAWEFLKRGLLTTAFCAGLSPQCCDLDTDDFLADVATPLMVASSPTMGRAKQQRLVQFLSGGGKLLVGPTLPSLDENFEPCTLLSDFLGQPRARKFPTAPVRLTIAEVVNVYNTGDVYFLENLPPGARVLGIDENTKRPCAALLPTAGGGTAILLGFRWHHAMREHSAMLRNLLTPLGLRQRLTCTNPNIWATVSAAGSRHVLFLLNLLSSPGETQVQCRLDTGMFDSGVQKLEPMSVKVIEF